jgi:hypothetical protein
MHVPVVDSTQLFIVVIDEHALTIGTHFVPSLAAVHDVLYF